ncbi:MAG: hypothetical protein ACI4JB_07390 [Porcipelethomonas sp.]
MKSYFVFLLKKMQKRRSDWSGVFVWNIYLIQRNTNAEVIKMTDKEVSSDPDEKITGKSIDKNQDHNVRKEALGPNTRR